VTGATVHVGEREVGRCDFGLLLLVGIHKNDTEREAEKLAQKILSLRIFNDHEGKMNLSLADFKDQEGKFESQILAVSNFTVYGDSKKQNRPSFMQSAGFEVGKERFDQFIESLRKSGIQVQTGEFGADMRVSLINSGPVTLIVDVDSPEISS
jgi:D-aminoacyl-tRNA deacylase